MASWIDDLAGHAAKSAKAKKPAKKPVVHQVICTIRPSDEETGDPGSCAIGHYTVVDDLLTMTDENGAPIKNSQDQMITHVLEPGSDARAIASVLTRKRSRGSGMRGFEKGELRYPKEGWR
jgi:hypothetical protein